MSISWLYSNSSIFGSFDVRDNFIKNLKKFGSIPIDKACAACGINYTILYNEYLNNPHPNPERVAMACQEYQFKNLMRLYGINITYKVTVAYNLGEESIKEINELIGERIKGRGVSSRKRS